MVTGSHSSIVTLNVNELNAPTKRHRLAECIPKQDPYIYCLLEIHLKPRDMNKLKVRDWKKKFHANADEKKAGIAILIPDKIDFEIKAVERDKEGHYIMSKGSIQEADIPIINIYAPNIGTRFHFSLSCIGEGNGNPLQCSCLENPIVTGAW